MKQKILDAIKRLYPGVNLSKKRLEKLAAVIEKRAGDDETKIDAAIQAYHEDNDLAEIARQDDQLRNLQAENKQLKDGKGGDNTGDNDGGTGSTKKETENDAGEDMPKWAKAMLGELTQLRAEKTTQTTMEKLTTTDLKDVPAVFWSKRTLPTKPEEYETFVTDVKTDYEVFAKENGIGQQQSNGVRRPVTGGTSTGSTQQTTGKGVVNPEIKTFMDSKQAKAAAGANSAGGGGFIGANHAGSGAAHVIAPSNTL